MNENVPKFLFLGVMIVMTALGGKLSGVSTSGTAIIAQANPAHFRRAEEPPLFVLTSPSAPLAVVPAPAIETSSILLPSPVLQPLQIAESEETDEGSSGGGTYLPEFVFSVPTNTNLGMGSLQSEETTASPPFRRIRFDAPPTVDARAAIIADMRTGEAYFTFHADRRWPIASITKLVTAAVATEQMDLSRPLVITDRDFVAGENGSVQYVAAGDTYSAKDLLRLLLLASSNEAAEALANSVGRIDFISRMNVLVKGWGMPSTYFSDPTGLSVADQSTANELVVLARNMYDTHPAAIEATRREKLSVTELQSGKRATVANINLFAGKFDFVGGKTGRTDEAGSNLLSIFSYPSSSEKDGRRQIVIVVLGAGDRFAETEKLFGWFKNNFTAN